MLNLAIILPQPSEKAKFNGRGEPELLQVQAKQYVAIEIICRCGGLQIVESYSIGSQWYARALGYKIILHFPSPIRLQ